jgi:hypothetical protein
VPWQVGELGRCGTEAILEDAMNIARMRGACTPRTGSAARRLRPGGVRERILDGLPGNALARAPPWRYSPTRKARSTSAVTSVGSLALPTNRDPQ